MFEIILTETTIKFILFVSKHVYASNTSACGHPPPQQVKDCLAYLQLVANLRDAVAMRHAINIPRRAIGPKTIADLELLVKSARQIPGLEAVTVPECLMSLLVAGDMDELERVLRLSISSSGGAGAKSFPKQGTHDGGLRTWPGESDDAATFPAAIGAKEDDGWRGFSALRVRALRKVLSERGGEIIEPSKRQVNKLRVFATLLSRLRVLSASQGVPELLKVVVKETNMYK